MCAALARLNLSNTTIAAAEEIAAGGFVPPPGSFALPMPPGVPPPYNGLPAFCRVGGTIAPVANSEIRFEVWLPTGWNGKFAAVGNGGAAGFIFYPFMAEALRGGYAVGATDTGHAGGMADWRFTSDREKSVDFGYRAVHEMTVTSKAVVEAHYGSAAKRSYWNGCSTGGRQGLVAARRFPDDFDGIVAGAPANNLAFQSIRQVLIEQASLDRVEPLTREKLTLLNEAAIAACDGADGVRDRTVNDPATCRFDPGVLSCTATATKTNCLTPRQVALARQVYSGIRDPQSGEQIFPGLPPTSEPDWLPPPFVAATESIGANYFRQVLHRDTNTDPSRVDLDADVARARKDDAVVSITDPDLQTFVQHGRKLLLWHGGSDGAIPVENTINYYNQVMAKTGGGQPSNQIRFFIAPGVQHCGGGEGAWQADLLSVIDQWVESGTAPERIVGQRPLQGGGTRTRPWCPYPQVATFNGQGHSDAASSFVCKAPVPRL
jgi:feruloyl esterase